MRRDQAFAAAFSLATLVCVALMGINSLTRIRDFTPDSMSYVDVARNIAAGRGVSQSALGFGRARFSLEDPIPAPFTAHAPGFSIAIALATKLGLRFTDAALLLPIVFLLVSLGAAYLLARDCWDQRVGWIAVALLLHYYPLRHTSAVAWSENMATCFGLAALWLLARRERRGADALQVWLIGAITGLAFAARYPMAPLAIVAAAAMVSWPMTSTTRREFAWLALGLICSAGPVLLRNVVLAHTLTGAASNPYYTPVSSNLSNTFWALSEIYSLHYLESPPRQPALWVLGGTLLVAAILLLIQRRLGSTLFDVFLKRGPRWIGLWIVSYVAFLVIVRSLTWFDDITHRLTVPAFVGLVILWAALAVRAIGANRTVSAALAMALLAGALVREVRFLNEHAPVARDVPPPMPRLLWVKDHTTGRDVIVGDLAMDLPFYFEDRKAIVFETYPYTAKLEYRYLAAYLSRHCHEFDHAYMIIRDWFHKDRMSWRRFFGPFVADLAMGDTSSYPEYSLLAKFGDCVIYRIEMWHCR